MVAIEEELLIEEDGVIYDTSISEHRPHNASVKEICRNKYLVCAWILAATGGILFGYDLGVISGALVQLKDVFDLTCFQQEMATSSMIIGALLASLFAGVIVDGLGRKTIIIASSILYGIGAAVVAIASSYNIFIFGRFILGAAISLSSTSECVYVSEISPPKYRGILVSSNELGITVGFLLAYCSNAIFANDIVNGWRWMFASSILFAFAMFFMGCWLPRSPRYLMMKGRIEEAKMIFSRLRCSDGTSEKFTSEWQIMVSHIHSTENNENMCTMFKNPAVKYSLFIGFSLMLMQQCTGQPNLLFYASTVLISFGFESGVIASTCSVSLGFAKLISLIIFMAVVEKFERKSILIVGCIVMAISILTVAVCAISFNNIGDLNACTNITLLEDHGNIKSDEILRWVVLFALILFVAAYAFSFGPIAWIFLGEIFPTHIRGKGFSFATSLNWGFQLLFSLTFLDFAKATGGVGWPFLLNSILTFASIIFSLKFIPKTKGKSLEEIQVEIKQRGTVLFSCTYEDTT